MQVLIKVAISLTIIFAATGIARKFPSIGGLVAVMPLTGALALAWTHWENKGDPKIMQAFVQGAFWGILPTMLFFFVAFLCLKKQLPLPVVLGAGFGAWLVAAFAHQWVLK